MLKHNRFIQTDILVWVRLQEVHCHSLSHSLILMELWLLFGQKLLVVRPSAMFSTERLQIQPFSQEQNMK